MFGQRDHVRIYGRDYTARLREAGFEVEEIDYGRSLRPDEIRRFGLDAAETITAARAPGLRVWTRRVTTQREGPGRDRPGASIIPRGYVPSLHVRM